MLPAFIPTHIGNKAVTFVVIMSRPWQLVISSECGKYSLRLRATHVVTANRRNRPDATHFAYVYTSLNLAQRRGGNSGRVNTSSCTKPLTLMIRVSLKKPDQTGLRNLGRSEMRRI